MHLECRDGRLASGVLETELHRSSAPVSARLGGPEGRATGSFGPQYGASRTAPPGSCPSAAAQQNFGAPEDQGLASFPMEQR